MLHVIFGCHYVPKHAEIKESSYFGLGIEYVYGCFVDILLFRYGIGILELVFWRWNWHWYAVIGVYFALELI